MIFTFVIITSILVVIIAKIFLLIIYRVIIPFSIYYIIISILVIIIDKIFLLIISYTLPILVYRFMLLYISTYQATFKT